MNTYRIAVINGRLNFRKYVYVNAGSASQAASIAREKGKADGYSMVESLVCVEMVG